MLHRAVDGGADSDAGETDQQNDDAREQARTTERWLRGPQAVNSPWCSARTRDAKAVSSGYAVATRAMATDSGAAATASGTADAGVVRQYSTALNSIAATLAAAAIRPHPATNSHHPGAAPRPTACRITSAWRRAHDTASYGTAAPPSRSTRPSAPSRDGS